MLIGSHYQPKPCACIPAAWSVDNPSLSNSALETRLKSALGLATQVITSASTAGLLYRETSINAGYLALGETIILAFAVTAIDHYKSKVVDTVNVKITGD